MNIYSVSHINKEINSDCEKFIDHSENYYLNQIKKAANYIFDNCAEKPIVLISGPSGSGKTSTALRLEKIMEELGKETFVLSMDDYFLPVDDPRNEVDTSGKIDFESPKRLDLKLLSEHLNSILNCDEITLPIFNFAYQRRDRGENFKRKNNQIVIIEGIHALNPDVTDCVYEQSICIYVSVRTRLESSEFRLLHPARIRLMRRLVRDKLFRGRSITDTLNFFNNVERGEQLYIMPYKYRANFDIDTFIAYEANAYKNFLFEDLAMLKYELSGENKIRCDEILTFFAELKEINKELIPELSLIREFVGK